MKSSNNYKSIVIILSLLLALLVVFAACDSGETGDETSRGGFEVSGDPADTENGGDPDDKNDPTDTGNASGTEGNGTGAGNTPAGTTSADGEGTNDPAGSDTMITYTVTVVDGFYKGFPWVIVKVYEDGVEVEMVATNSTGEATFELAPGEYTFTVAPISDADSYTYDTSACVLSTTATSATVMLLQKAGGSTAETTTPSQGGSTNNPGGSGGSNDPVTTQPIGGGETTEPGQDDPAVPSEGTIYADPDGDGNGKNYYAPSVSAGSTAVDVPANDMAYFRFTPYSAGVYQFSLGGNATNVRIGYYGSPHYVQSNNVANMNGNSFEIEVPSGSAGQATYIIGLKTTDGSAASGVILLIERIGSATETVAWEEPYADSKYLVKYTGPTTGTLVDLDVTDPNLSAKVLKGSDGYYHFDTNGNGVGEDSEPVVMMRITSNSPYIDSFYKICETSSFCAYYFDAAGVCQRRVRYNAVINAYAEVVVSEESGVVPLNDQLIEMIKEVGTYMGWWNEAAQQYRFGSVNEATESAWLFACCYYA